MGIISVFAVSMSAFTSIPAKTTATGYFWYDADTGVLLNEIRSELPPNGCTLSGSEVCAYGHIEETNTPGTGEFVTAYHDGL